MRDLLLTTIVFGAIPFIFYRPYIGILVWAWLTYMTPYRYTWGFAYDFRFALVIAAVTLVAWLLSKESKRVPWNPVSILLILFWVWATITTPTAQFPDAAWPEWERVSKGILMNGLLVMILFSDRLRLNTLLWVIVVSIGFFGIKGGVFTLMTGGVYTVAGAQDSFIGSNNYLAAALLMIMPMMRYLQLVSPQRVVRWGLGLAMALCAVSVLGTQSRMGFIGLLVLALALVLRSRRRIALTLGLMATLALGIGFMPASWHDRMETIVTFQEDRSVQGRFRAWDYGLAVASEHPLTGGGFEVFRGNKDETIAGSHRSSHSIYFQVLGEHGYLGLALYLALALAALLTCQSTVRRTKPIPELGWAHDLARLSQTSCVLFLVTGAASNFAYFELYITFIGIAGVLFAAAKRATAEATGPEELSHEDCGPRFGTRPSA